MTTSRRLLVGMPSTRPSRCAMKNTKDRAEDVGFDR